MLQDLHGFLLSDVEKHVSNFISATHSTLTDAFKNLTTSRPKYRPECRPWPTPCFVHTREVVGGVDMLLIVGSESL